MTHNEYLTNLKLDNWFSHVFDEQKDIPHDNRIIIVDNLEYAVEIWKNNFENRCDSWELLRIRLVNNDVWKRNFHSLRKGIFDGLETNSYFRKLSDILLKDYDVSIEQFVSELPAVGAWGESLLNLTSGYYNKQISYYKNGFWVCGIDNDVITLL